MPLWVRRNRGRVLRRDFEHEALFDLRQRAAGDDASTVCRPAPERAIVAKGSRLPSCHRIDLKARRAPAFHGDVTSIRTDPDPRGTGVRELMLAAGSEILQPPF